MLEKINQHYSFTAPATIFNEEALTTLELAARTAAKVNECVDAFNKFEDHVNRDVKEQRDYISEIDTLIQGFLGEGGVPTEVAGSYAIFSDIIHKYVNEGRFAEIYDKFKDYVLSILAVERTRIDMILAEAAPVPEGAEVLDLRTDAKGHTWANAGTAVRNSFRAIIDQLDSFTKVNTCELENGEDYSDGVWQDDGQWRAGFGNARVYHVTAGEQYLVSSYYGYKIPDVVFTDDNSNFIALGNLHAGAMKKNLFATVHTVPEGATRMWVQWADADADPNLIKARKITGYTLDLEALEKFIETALKPLDSLNPTYTIAPIEGSAQDGFVITRDVNEAIYRVEMGDGNTAYKIATYKLEAGERVKFECCANFGNLFYYLYNSESGQVYKYEESTQISNRQTIEREIIVPIGVDRITLANIEYLPECLVMRGVKDYSALGGVSAFAFGDSITEFNDSAERNYIEMVQDITGIDIYNLANSGAGFLNEKASNTHFLGQVIKAPTTGTPKLAIFMGSGNDLKYVESNLGKLGDTDQNSLYGQMYNCMMLINTKYNGNTRVAFIAPVAWRNYAPRVPDNAMEKYVEAMRTFCRAYCVPFLDLYHEGGLDPMNTSHNRFFDAEGVHPNEDGHKIIAPRIAEFLRGIVSAEV